MVTKPIQQQANDLMKGGPMAKDDQALIRFGELAATVQQNPGGKSNSEELMLIKLCLTRQVMHEECDKMIVNL